MREQLSKYIDLLFAGAPGAEDMKQEILQNTLDRYDDLISQGKTPEAAYRLAISGIGDINELLGSTESPCTTIPAQSAAAPSDPAEERNSRIRRAVAIAMYILCPVPLFLLGDVGSGVIGLSLMFILVAGATALLIMNKDDESHEKKQEVHYTCPRGELKKSIGTMISTVGLVVFFVVSFATGAWYITWVIFPILAAVKGLVNAVIDLKEANKYEA